MHRNVKWLITGIIALFTLTASSQTQGSPPPALEITPSALTLSPGATSEFRVALRNPTGQPLSDVILSVLDDPSIQISALPAASVQVPPGSDFLWQLNATRLGDLPAERKIHFQLSYQTQLEGQNTTVQKTIFGVLSVAPQALPPVENIAAVQVNSALKSLLEQRKGLIYLVVQNKSDQPLTIHPPVPSGPDFVKFYWLPTTDIVIPPRDAHTIPLLVQVTDQVQPGKHLLFFEVPLSRERPEAIDSYHLTASYEVDVGVLGESEVLKILEIPSFLLLPGVLAVVTVGLWWQLFKPAEQKDKFPLKARNEYFWVVAISVSILIAALYPPITEWVLKERRNYLFGYGLLDIVLAWTLGILTGVVYVSTTALARFLVDMVQVQRQKRNFPEEGNNVFDLLPKLKRQKLELALPEVNLANDAHPYFLLQAPRATLTHLWISRPVLFTFTDEVTADQERDITRMLVPSADLEQLGDLLKTAVASGGVNITQDADPRLVARQDLTFPDRRDLFVQQG